MNGTKTAVFFIGLFIASTATAGWKAGKSESGGSVGSQPEQQYSELFPSSLIVGCSDEALLVTAKWPQDLGEPLSQLVVTHSFDGATAEKNVHMTLTANMSTLTSATDRPAVEKMIAGMKAGNRLVMKIGNHEVVYSLSGFTSAWNQVCG